MIKRRATEYSHGLMVVNTTVNGAMVNRTVSVCTQYRMERANKEDGSKGKEWNGSEHDFPTNYITI